MGRGLMPCYKISVMNPHMTAGSFSRTVFVVADSMSEACKMVEKTFTGEEKTISYAHYVGESL
jgi:hypothetical protein